MKQKKLIYLFLFFLLWCGCCLSDLLNKEQEIQQEVISKIEQEEHCSIAIHIPVTNVKMIDTTLEQLVQKTEQHFKQEYCKSNNQAELNIDYTYHETDHRYLNITLTTYINSFTLAHPTEEIITYVYDQEKKKIIDLKDLIDRQDLDRIVPLIQESLVSSYQDCLFMDQMKEKIVPNFKSYPLFTIEEHQLTFYFNPYELAAGSCGILKVQIPLEIIEKSFGEITTPSFKICPKKQIFIDPKKKIVALTFDDGPSKYTKEILSILKENNARATFFVLGNKVEMYQKTIEEMVKNGNEIGNHSYNHKWLTRLTNREIKEQIDTTNRLVKEITGCQIQLLRPTYGAVNNYLRKETNLNITMWTVDTRDWELTDSKKIAEKGMEHTKNYDIILMHDVRERTVEAVRLLVPELQKKGFQFVTVSELNELKKLESP